MIKLYLFYFNNLINLSKIYWLVSIPISYFIYLISYLFKLNKYKDVKQDLITVGNYTYFYVVIIKLISHYSIKCLLLKNNSFTFFSFFF